MSQPSLTPLTNALREEIFHPANAGGIDGTPNRYGKSDVEKALKLAEELEARLHRCRNANAAANAAIGDIANECKKYSEQISIKQALRELVEFLEVASTVFRLEGYSMESDDCNNAITTAQKLLEELK